MRFTPQFVFPKHFLNYKVVFSQFIILVYFVSLSNRIIPVQYISVYFGQILMHTASGVIIPLFVEFAVELRCAWWIAGIFSILKNNIFFLF